MKKILLVLAFIGVVTQVNAQGLILKSTVEVEYNVYGSINQKDTTKIEGKIKRATWENNFSKVDVDYSYLSDVGANIKTAAYSVTGAEIQAMYETIKDSIPQGITRAKTEEWEMYLGFRYIMAGTFNISVGDIQIVEDID